MASAAAAMAARARRELQHRFFAADAVRVERAIAFTPANHFEERQFARLLGRGAIREDGAGRFWLDLPAYDAVLRERHARVRAALIVVALLLGATLIFAGLFSARQTAAIAEHGAAALPAGAAR